MLQSFRDNLKGVTAAIVVGLLIIPFAFFGVESLFVSGSSVQEEVSVNGESITRLEIERAIEYQKQRILSQYPDADPVLLNDERLREPVVDQLIRQRLLTAAATENGLAISENTFNEMMVNNPAFQRDGRFDSALYEYYLNRLGFTPRSYRDTVTKEVLASHLTSGIQATALNTETMFKDFSRLALQERSFDYLVLASRDVAGVDVSQEEITEYYHANEDQFREPEKAVVEYIELTPEILAESIQLDDEQIESRLIAERETSVDSSTSWSLAHILVDPAAQSDADAIVAQVAQALADGEDFSTVAKEYSDDFGSAENGGELGNFIANALPPGFESAIADLQPGEVSEPVKLESGFHFIKVLDKSETAAVPMSREEVVAQLRREFSLEQLPAKLDQLKEETFSVDSLESAADVLALPVVVSEPFSRDGGEGIAKYPAVVDATFSKDVLDEGYASEVLDLGENRHLVVKLRSSIPSQLASLDQVAEEVRRTLAIRKAQAITQSRSEEVLEALESDKTLNEIAVEEELEVKSESGLTRFDQRVPPVLVNAIFRSSLSANLPFFGSATALNGDIYVFSVNRIEEGGADVLSEAESRAMRDSLRQVIATREYIGYLDSLEERADIVRRASSSSDR